MTSDEAKVKLDLKNHKVMVFLTFHRISTMMTRIRNPPTLPPTVYQRMSVVSSSEEPCDTRRATWNHQHKNHAVGKKKIKMISTYFKHFGWNLAFTMSILRWNCGSVTWTNRAHVPCVQDLNFKCTRFKFQVYKI